VHLGSKIGGQSGAWRTRTVDAVVATDGAQRTTNGACGDWVGVGGRLGWSGSDIVTELLSDRVSEAATKVGQRHGVTVVGAWAKWPTEEAQRCLSRRGAGEIPAGCARTRVALNRGLGGKGWARVVWRGLDLAGQVGLADGSGPQGKGFSKFRIEFLFMRKPIDIWEKYIEAS
jgi:hypothetical protein